MTLAPNRRDSIARRLLLVAVSMLVLSCGGQTVERTVVSATLQDHSIELSQTSVTDGSVSFEVSNEGNLIHEFEVFAGDNADLGVTNAVVNVAGLRLVDEVEDIPPGTSLRLDVDLEPGHYVIICNLPGHYEAGMVSELEVTG